MSTPYSPPSRVRYEVLLLACTLSLITYLDRVCMMRVKRDISQDLGFNDIQMGWVFSAFLFGYALFEVPAGWLGDRFGARRVLIFVVLWWSVFTAFTGLIRPFVFDLGITVPLGNGVTATLFDSFVALVLVRFWFGAGEAGAYPNLARVTATWFPDGERAGAQGAIWMSARLGGALAPWVIGRLSAAVGWRMAFVLLGLLGLGWCLWFMARYRDDPATHPDVNDAERQEIGAGTRKHATAHEALPWAEVVSQPTFWGMMIAAFGVSFGWYFYPTWQPTYLAEVHKVSFENSELLTGLPFLCGAVGCLLGGRLSDLLVTWTGNKRIARSGLGMVGFTAAGLCVAATGWTTEAWQAVALLCLAFFVNDLAIPALWATFGDVGGRYAATLAGFMNMIGAFGGMISPVLIPYLIAGFDDYTPAERWQGVFLVLSGAWFAAAIGWFLIDPRRPLVTAHDHSNGTHPDSIA